MSTSNDDSDRSLKTQWRHFLSTIFYPPVIVFLAGTIILLISSYFTDNKLITALISALMITSAAIFGSFIRKRWEELTEKPHLLAKAKMAVRNLRLLSNNIGYYELRLRKYINRIDNNDLSKERALEYFEEFIDWCLSLREICLTSIENWEDIIPEVKDLTSNIGKLFDLRISEEELKNQIASLSKRLYEAEKEQDETQEEKGQLLKQLSEKEEEVKLVGKQVKELRQSIQSSVGGLALTSGYSGINYLGAMLSGMEKRNCKYCGKEYTPKGYGLLSIDNICEECASKGKGPPLSGGS